MVFCIAGGIILPTLVSFFAFGETMSPWKWVAVLISLCAVYMMSYRSSGKVEWKRAFIPCCIGLALANGAYGTILNTQQQLTGEGEKEELIAITYAIAAAVSFIIYLAKERGSVRGFRQTKASLIYLVFCSVVVALAINVLVSIIPLINITVLYTFDNAGTLLLSVICSVVFFKERLTKLNVVGCAVMCASLVMISLV
jgi:drug/metabolite transporter (DMT)-like permease